MTHQSAPVTTERRRNWGRWGSDDERGTLNLITPQTTLDALRFCTTGRLYQLGLPVQRSGVPHMSHRGGPQRLTLINHQDESMHAPFGGRPGIGTGEDILVLPTHDGTHIDALCHIYADDGMYNGFPPDGVAPYTGAAHGGIERAGAFATKGVLFDVPALKGVPWLEPGYCVTPADLEQCLERQGATLPPGSAALVRTGWVEQFLAEGEGDTHTGQPGIGVDAADWLADADVAVIGCDNTAVEHTPFDAGLFLPVHVACLVDNGIHLLEHVHLAQLAADGCHEFLFLTAPLLVTGATGSPVNPVAIG